MLQGRVSSQHVRLAITGLQAPDRQVGLAFVASVAIAAWTQWTEIAPVGVNNASKYMENIAW